MKYTFPRIYKERRSKPFLLLEIGIYHLRLYAIDSGTEPIGVNLLREESLLHGDSTILFDAVQNMLPADSHIRAIAIVINSPVIRHQMLCLPPLSREKRQKILLQEMKTSFPSQEGHAITSFWSAGKVKEQGITKEYVLGAELPRPVAEGLIAAVQEKKLNFIGFTSHAQMMSHLLKECRLEGNSNVALLEVNEHESSITLFHSNIWNMDRHFLVGSPSAFRSPEAPAALDADKLRLEVGRALQYFKQQVRSENINHIFLLGSTNHVSEIKRILESSFRIPLTPVALEGKTFAMKNLASDEEKKMLLYGIAHAAALHARFENYIDFLPPEWREKKHFKIGQLAVVGSAAVSYLLLGGIGYVLHREAANLPIQNQADSQIIAANNGRNQHMRQIQAERSFALAAEQSDAWLRGKHRIVAELARELASAAPPQMRISGLEVTEKGNAWQVKLDAEIRSSNGSNSQRLFLKFQEEMRQLSCLKQLTWGEIQLSDTAPLSDIDRTASGSTSQNLLTFTMQGMLNYPVFSAKPSPDNPS
jgi:hypothetical protein